MWVRTISPLARSPTSPRVRDAFSLCYLHIRRPMNRYQRADGAIPVVVESHSIPDGQPHHRRADVPPQPLSHVARTATHPPVCRPRRRYPTRRRPTQPTVRQLRQPRNRHRRKRTRRAARRTDRTARRQDTAPTRPRNDLEQTGTTTYEHTDNADILPGTDRSRAYRKWY